jgi:hypothetical protein
MSAGTKTIKSDGVLSARGYAVMEVRPAGPEPPAPAERVMVVRPTHTATRTGRRAGAGPRNPQQTAWPPAKGPPIVLPDGRPLTKAQRFWIDPEMLAQWDAEASARSSP